MKTALLKIIFAAVLLTGCRPTDTVNPDPTKPHKISQKVKVKVWVRREGRDLQEVEVEVLPGWWLLPPQWANRQ